MNILIYKKQFTIVECYWRNPLEEQDVWFSLRGQNLISVSWKQDKTRAAESLQVGSAAGGGDSGNSGSPYYLSFLEHAIFGGKAGGNGN